MRSDVEEVLEREQLKLDTAKLLVGLLERLVTAESETHWRPHTAVVRDKKKIAKEANDLVEAVGVEIATASADLLSEALWSLLHWR